MNISGRRNGWAAPAMGLAILLTIVAETMKTDNLLVRAVVSFAYPMIFILSGYLNLETVSGKKLRRLINIDLHFLVLPWAGGIFIQWVLRRLGEIASKSDITPAQSVRAMLFSYLYSTGVDSGDLRGIGSLWILISLFTARLIIRLAHYIADSMGERLQWSYTRQDVMEYILEAAIGVTGLILQSQYITLPLNLGESMFCVLLMLLGMLWKRFFDIMCKPAVYLGSFAAAAVVWILGIYNALNHHYMVMNRYIFGWDALSILVSVCGVYAVACLVRQICRADFIRDTFALAGRHIAVYIFIYNIDALFARLWNYDYETPRIILRLFADMAMSELVIMLWNRLIRDHFSQASTRKDAEYGLRYGRVINVCYYILFAVYFPFQFLDTTLYPYVFSNSVRAMYYDLYLTPCVAALLIFALSIPRLRSIPFLILELAIMAAGYAHTVMNGGSDYYIFAALVFIVAASGKSFRIIAGICLAESAVMYLGTYAASTMGRLSYRTDHTDTTGISGHAFGFIDSPNNSAHLLFIGILYTIVQRKRSWTRLLPDIAVLGFLNWFTFRYIRTATDVLCLGLLFIGTIFYDVFAEFRFTKGHWFERVIRGIHYVLGIGTFIFVIVFTIATSVLYEGQQFWFEKRIPIDWSTFDNRMNLGKTAFMVYPVKPFGNYVMERGAGGFVDTSAAYFFIDSSYLRLIVIYGAVLSVLIMATLIMAQIHHTRQRNYFYVFLMVILAIESISVHHLLDLSMNILPMMAFAYTGILFKATKEYDRQRWRNRTRSLDREQRRISAKNQYQDDEGIVIEDMNSDQK